MSMANNYVKCGRCKGTGAIRNVGIEINCPVCGGVGKIRSDRL